jgi:hypothetical protein
LALQIEEDVNCGENDGRVRHKGENLKRAQQTHLAVVWRESLDE